jgi:uncharacterized membrane protein
VKCPNCSRENEVTSRFCIFCGTSLASDISEPPELPPESLEQEVQQLRGSIRRINERLTALEQRQGIGVASRVEQRQLEGVERSIQVQREVKPPRPPREWEQILGGNWLARIGVLALLFGVGFFLKYAFDRNWILPVIRILLGVVAGLIMLGGGYLWRKKYPVLTQVLTGGGIGVMYLSIFASFNPYDLIPFILAVILLLVVCIASVVLALRYNSMALAVLGIIGAFIAPFVLRAFDTGGAITGQTGSGFEILGYTVIIDIGVLVIATFRNWRWFTLLALLFSLVIFGVWYGAFGDVASIAGAEIVLTIIFLIFIGATTMFHIFWRQTPQPFDYILMVLNAIGYTSISLGLLWGDFRDWVGGFALLLALFYVVLAYLTLKRSLTNLRISLFAVGIAIVLITIAFPIQFGDRAWTTIAWVTEGALLLWLSTRLPLQLFRWAGYGVFIITAFRLLIFDTTISLANYVPVVNERFLAFLFGIAGMYLAGYLLIKVKNKLNEKEAKVALPILFIAANFFTLWLLSAEILNAFDHALYHLSYNDKMGNPGDSLRNFQNLSITGLWAFYAVIALIIGIIKRIRFLRLGALALLLVAIAKVFVYDVFKLAMVYRIVAFVGLGLLLLASGYLYQRYSKRIREFLIKE